MSSSKTSAEIAKEAAERAKAEQQANSQRKKVIIGVAVGVGVSVVAAVALGGWWYKKRRDDRDEGTWDDQDVVARAYELPFADVPEMQEGALSSTPLMSKVSAVEPYTPLGSPGLQVTPIPPVYFDREILHVLDSQSQSGSGSDSQYLTSASSSKSRAATAESLARYRKALEARSQTSSVAGPSSSAYTSPTNHPSSPHSLRMDTMSPQFVPTALDPDVQPDIIIQHRDGGAGVVQELPPPYVDRTQLKPSSPLATSPLATSPHEFNSP